MAQKMGAELGGSNDLFGKMQKRTETEAEAEEKRDYYLNATSIERSFFENVQQLSSIFYIVIIL